MPGRSFLHGRREHRLPETAPDLHEVETYPLAKYAGAHPPEPEWFSRAIAIVPEDVPLVHDGARIETLAWGRRGAPGLLLIHGNRAHARWWSPIAPILANHFRVAAFSLPGMGGSDWRKTYSLTGYAEEAMAAAEAAGLFEADAKPVFAGHSFGGGPVLAAAEKHGERLAGIMAIDSFIQIDKERPEGPPPRAHRVYPSLADALARFRLAPPQPFEHPCYIDWIARHALKHVGSGESGGPGWQWRFDPWGWEHLGWHDRWQAATQTNCPMAVIDGELSGIGGPHRTESLRAHMPPDTQFHIVEDAHHHIMLDRPLELANLIAEITRGWQSAA